MSYVLQFVDSIAADPGVRLDLKGPGWTVRPDSSFTPPELRYAKVSSLLADGAQFPASAYDARYIKLTLRVDGLSDDAIAAAVQPLLRELDRTRNLLRYQPGTSAPVFFKTFRAGPSNVVWDPFTKEYTATVPADPFAYGLRETLPPVTVYNDPVEGTTINSNPYFETDTSGWVGADGTITRSTAQAHEGVASLLLTPDGVGSSPRAEFSPLVPVTAGETYRVSAWVRCAVARTVEVAITWFTAAGVFIVSSGNALPGGSVAAGVWTFASDAFVAPAGAGLASIRVRMTGTPPASNLLWIDEARLRKAGGVGGCCFEVTGIKGDVETPLNLILPTSGLMAASVAGRRMSAIAVRRRGTPSAAPFVLQAEAMTIANSGDTTVQANNAVMSGGGGNSVRITFASGAMATRLSTEPWPAVGGRDIRGGYKAFMRYRQSTASGSPMQAQLVWGRSGSGRTFTNDPVSLVQFDGGAGGPYMKYAYLGEVQFPAGYDPVTDGPTGVEIGAEGMYIGVQAARTSGTAALDIDCLVFLPADDKLLLAKWPASVSLPADLVLESDRGQVYPRSANGFTVPAPGAELDGGPPMVYPGSVTNRLYFLRDVGTDSSTSNFGTGDDITATTTITPYYHPRYLHVRPVAS